MITRGLDQDQDWIFGINKSAYKIKQDAIMQNISTKIREWVGDCFFNNNAGIDWINRLDFNQKTQLDADLQSLIIQCEGVAGLLELRSFSEGRNFTVTYTVETFYSQSAQGETSNQS